MFSYASKRITRGRGLSLALFLSVVLAATLFSGILQGADAVGGSMVDNMLKSTRYDIITSNIYEKNVTRTNLYGIDAYFNSLPGVKGVDHFLREDIELNSTTVNGTIPVTIVSLPTTGELAKSINAPGGLEDGKVYVDLGSTNATLFTAGQTIDLGLLTYTPYSGIANFERKYFPIQVGTPISIDDQTWSIFLATTDGKPLYNRWVSAALSGNDNLGGRPLYNLVVVTENTYKAILNQLYDNPIQLQRRAPTIIHSVACIRLDRAALINQWDIQGTEVRVQNLAEQINGMSGVYSYIPVNYLELALKDVAANSNKTKLNTIVVTIPVFFTAWYLGMTVSDVAFGLRRKEIGLLLTRGMSHRQIFTAFLSEALLFGLVSGVMGVVIGAVVIPFVVSGADFTLLFRYVTPITLGATMIFSLVLSILAAYNPARKVTQIEIVEALSEYREEEETLGGWQVPLLSLVLGLYKLVFLLLSLDIESFRPTSGDFITFLLYSTWYGMDYLFGFIWTILLFWGFTKLFLMYAPQFQVFLGAVASRLTGDAARFTSISTRRNLKRVGAYTFMAALIISYSVVVIGNSAMTNDYTNRLLQAQQGADASILLYSRTGITDLANKIRGMAGVESATIELSFLAETSAGTIPIRVIEVDQWNKTAYPDDLSIDKGSYAMLASKDSVFRNQYGVLQGGYALLDKGAADFFGLRADGTGDINISVERNVYTLRIVGAFGRDMGANWVPQNPTAYVPLAFVQTFHDEWINGARILVKLAPRVDPQTFNNQVKALGPNVQRIDVTSLVVRRAEASPLIGGSQQVIQLGIIFAAAVSSVGMALIAYTLLRSRSKELNLMSIRGYSARQLSVSLITENVGLAVFATILGIGIGIVSLQGQVQLYNKYVLTYTSWRLVFPAISQLQLALFFIVIVAATVAPIILVVRRITDEPNIKGEA